MQRGLAMLIVLAHTTALAAQDHPAGKEASVEQFDGKTLQGWEIDGESKIEDGTLQVGGKSQAKMRLTAPLGDRFAVRMECQYTSDRPHLRLATSARTFEHPLPGWPGPWATLLLERSRGDFSFSYRLNYSFRDLDDSESSGGWWPDVGGDVREFALIIPEDCKLTIRRISLETTRPGEAPSTPWIPLAFLFGILLTVVALGWFLHRRKSRVPASPLT